MLCPSFIERLFCLPSVQNCAVLAALNSINYITLLMPGCSVLRVDKFLPQCGVGFIVTRDMMSIKMSDVPATYGMTVLRFLVSSSLSALDLLAVLTKVQFG